MLATTLKPPAERKTMATQPLRSLDQILALADNGNYLPDLLLRNDALIAEMQNFSQA